MITKGFLYPGLDFNNFHSLDKYKLARMQLGVGLLYLTGKKSFGYY